jgi:hypothetical protein
LIRVLAVGNAKELASMALGVKLCERPCLPPGRRRCERVEAPDQLPAALERALHAVRMEKRQALLNVIVSRRDAQNAKR